MRIFSIQTHEQITETDVLPAALPEHGFLWMAFARREFEIHLPQVQATLKRLCHAEIDFLHAQDVLNNQLPSHYAWRVVSPRPICPSPERSCTTALTKVGHPS